MKVERISVSLINLLILLFMSYFYQTNSPSQPSHTKRKHTFWDSKELQELDTDDVQVFQLDASSIKAEEVSIYEVGMRTVNT